MTMGSEAPIPAEEPMVASPDALVTPSGPIPLSTANSAKGGHWTGRGRGARGLPSLNSVALPFTALVREPPLRSGAAS